MSMTRRQRMHFYWLVLSNAEEIANRAQDKHVGSSIIERAQNKRRELKLPMHRIYDEDKMDRMSRIIASVSSVNSDIEDPF